MPFSYIMMSRPPNFWRTHAPFLLGWSTYHNHLSTQLMPDMQDNWCQVQEHMWRWPASQNQSLRRERCIMAATRLELQPWERCTIAQDSTRLDLQPYEMSLPSHTPCGHHRPHRLRHAPTLWLLCTFTFKKPTCMYFCLSFFSLQKCVFLDGTSIFRLQLRFGPLPLQPCNSRENWNKIVHWWLNIHDK